VRLVILDSVSTQMVNAQLTVNWLFKEFVTLVSLTKMMKLNVLLALSTLILETKDIV